MAGKNPRLLNPVKRLNYDKLKPSEVLCPVCRTIFVEPVTLPCHHAFCRVCFEDTMEKVNLGCPLCRSRVGSWARIAKKNDKFVNKEFWMAIQRQFPKELRNKYNGIDNDFERETPVIVVASQGDIRKEYEKERQKDLEEQNKLKAAEETASAALIKKLREEEEHQNKIEAEKLKADELLAQKLEEELNNTPSTSNHRPRPSNSDSAKKAGPMDRFIKTRLMTQKTPSASKNSSSDIKNNPQQQKQNPKRLFVDDRKLACISSGDNSDIIDQECRFYFKPIDLHKKYHKPGKVPVKVPAVRGIRDTNYFIRPPSGDNPKMGYGQTAFAWFISCLSTDPERVSTKEDTAKPTIKKELPSTSANSIVKTSKRKSTNSFENTKLPKKRERLLNNARKIDSVRKNNTPFHNRRITRRSTRQLVSPVLFGFTASQVKESENVLNKFIKSANLPINNVPHQSNLDSKLIKDSIAIRKLQHKNYPIDINRNIPKSNNVCLNNGANSINGEINGLSPESPVINNFFGKKLIQFNKPIDESILLDTPPGDFDSSDSEEDVVLANLIESFCDNSSPVIPKQAKKASPKKVPLPVAGTSKPFNNLGIPAKVLGVKEEILQNDCFSNLSPEEKKRKRQERDDLALAKKLQAEFDRIHVLPTTRRGTARRQVTLDEMLTV